VWSNHGCAVGEVIGEENTGVIEIFFILIIVNIDFLVMFGIYFLKKIKSIMHFIII
jgi:hypothetical protein